jgi:hypothetical protein
MNEAPFMTWNWKNRPGKHLVLTDYLEIKDKNLHTLSHPHLGPAPAGKPPPQGGGDHWSRVPLIFIVSG